MTRARENADIHNGSTAITSLGTVTAGNLSNEAIIMPRFKEHSRYHYATATSTTAYPQTAINISGTLYATLTPEDTGDVLEFGWTMNTYANGGYIGFGIQRATDTGFTAGVATVWSTGQHASGKHGHATGDFGNYEPQNGYFSVTATGLSVGTTYYFRIILSETEYILIQKDGV